MRSRLKWDDIELFLAVAREGSFARAGAVLGLTQPTISRRVEQMETDLNTKLFTRGTNGVTLTNTASTVIRWAEQMDRSARKFLDAVEDSHEDLTGIVGLSAPDGIAAYWIMPQLSNFIDRYPNLEIALDCGLWPMDRAHAANEVSLSVQEPLDLDLIRIPLCWLHYSLFASRDYIRRFGMPTTYPDLLKHRVIRHSGQVMQRENWADKTEAIESLASNVILTNSSAASLMALKQGLGIGAAPTAVLDIENALVPIPLGRSASIRLFLCYSKEAMESAKVRALIDWLKEIFDPRKNIWFQEDFVDPSEKDVRRRTEQVIDITQHERNKSN